jgi:hypothetical protein
VAAAGGRDGDRGVVQRHHLAARRHRGGQPAGDVAAAAARVEQPLPRRRAQRLPRGPADPADLRVVRHRLQRADQHLGLRRRHPVDVGERRVFGRGDLHPAIVRRAAGSHRRRSAIRQPA